MKAERVQKKEFRPILITIETEAEAKALWHRLNVGTGDLAGYIRGMRLNAEDLKGFAMWGVFDSVYNAGSARNKGATSVNVDDSG